MVCTARLLCTLIVISSGNDQSNCVLVEDCRPASAVLGPGGGSELEEIALRDFLAYIEKATGARMPVIADGERHTGKTIVVLGVAEAPTPPDAALKNMPRHAFRYRATPTRLEIIGADPGGLAKGVHWFLRRKVGVRWYMPGGLGEEIPRHTTLELKREEVCCTPEFEWVRMTGNRSFLPEEVIWGVRHGDDILDGAIRNHWFRSHNWAHVVPPTKENIEDHPDWFAREEGLKPTLDPRLNVDVSHPEVVRKFITTARAYFDSDPERVMFSLESNDSQYYGNSGSLKLLRERLGPEAIGTDEFIWFCNQVAAGVRETHPGKILGFYAYGHHMWAPRVVKADPMLSFMMCRHGGRACARHSLLDPRNSVNAQWRENFERWCRLLELRGYYAYWADYSWFGPTPLDRLAEDLPYLKGKGVYQLNSENRFSWATNAPYYYLALRMVQDTRLDPEAVLDDFCRGMYGPARAPMKRYWTRWSRAWDAALPRDREGYHYETTYLPSHIEAAYQDLREARQRAAGQAKRYRDRVELAHVGLRFTDYYLRMLRQAADGRYGAAIETVEEIREIVLESAELGRPAAFALHPSSQKNQMALDRLTSDVRKYRERLKAAK